MERHLKMLYGYLLLKEPPETHIYIYKKILNDVT